MKINIQTDPGVTETQINIVCSRLTPELEKVLSLLRVMDKKLTGTRNGQTYLLNSDKILYIDTVDKKTFFYTKDGIYETTLRLYELEEQLDGSNFFRASKSCIIHMGHIKSLKADLDGRILVTMDNSERLFVSRQYAKELKKKLGVR